MVNKNVQNSVILLLGSNMGNRAQYIELALSELRHAGCVVLKQSRCFETESWGFQSEHFINQGIQIETKLPAHELLALTQDIERKNGRTKKAGIGYEARSLDIDIIFFNDEVIESTDLKVPHPRMHSRRFVLEPLNDIIPGYRHPVLRKNINMLLNECTDSGKVKPIKKCITEEQEKLQ